MRGKVLTCLARPRVPGITPAYAGKRYEYDKVLEFYKDHPRLCGEKVYYIYDGKQCKGSPPPMRGKDEFLQLLCTPNRITPAYAGKSR